MATKMSSTHQSLALLLFFLLTLSSAHAKGDIAVYWGQHSGDGTLSSTCDTGNYGIVLLAFLNTFGCSQDPALNLPGNCGSGPSCNKLQPEIEHCQQKGVKVFLSLGGPTGQYFLCSPEDAGTVADYLYNNFLSDKGGPLGSVALDGIDFDIEIGQDVYWDKLVSELDTRRKTKGRFFYLSASPQCFFPDPKLDTAIRTWLFDYIFIKFYNNPKCQYNSNTGDNSLLTSSWNQWSSYVKENNKVYLGLPARPDAAPIGGYIPSQELCSRVLPKVKQIPNYGGVMLWDRSYDVTTTFSDNIKACVEVVTVSQM
ncbi:hypothetical protein PIB30_041162 [Stylosanthes scabra]|uniref:chitinase n=1 Tax=Stylosanthes scabra TaxID=79078 RepID=A0ABU6VDV4_9FABA|nr:hypothetical protein [Stylosanthes scabra]